MNQEPIRIVPFDGLWKMAIDVPYSMLAGRGDNAWSCGQLAMDQNAQVVAPGDLPKQCHVVADFIEEILRRADMQPSGIRRLVLYYVGRQPNDQTNMRSFFRARFGPNVALDAVAVPEFYYSGVLLEVDVFCSLPVLETREPTIDGGRALVVLTKNEAWVSLEVTPANVAAALEALKQDLAQVGISAENTLNEHWVASTKILSGNVLKNINLGRDIDVPAILDGGPDLDRICLRATIVREGTVTGSAREIDGVHVITRLCGDDAWLQARPTGKHVGLVEQTKAAMCAFEAELARVGAGFTDVIKQTAHYVGGTADELHDNMTIRNAYYDKPGPGSTGIPVFGYAESTIRTVVDLRVKKGWRGS